MQFLVIKRPAFGVKIEAQMRNTKVKAKAKYTDIGLQKW